MAEEFNRKMLNYDDPDNQQDLPPHSKKDLVSPTNYERQLGEQGDLSKDEMGGRGGRAHRG